MYIHEKHSRSMQIRIYYRAPMVQIEELAFILHWLNAEDVKSRKNSLEPQNMHWSWEKMTRGILIEPR